MIKKLYSLLLIQLCIPTVAFGALDSKLLSSIAKSKSVSQAIEAYENGANGLKGSSKYKGKISEGIISKIQDVVESNISTAKAPMHSEAEIKELEDKYKSAKENEQSLANRTLTATTIAATGLGTMELMEGLAAKKTDAAADRDMTAYLETFRCTYGDGKQVKGGNTPVELPGGNNAELMKLRNEYVALATDLKERKTSLGLKPGIESEEILDKANMGLYDDENVGITGGAFASLYRAKALGSEEDQKKLDEETKKANDRIKGGAIAAGVGTVIGVTGNSLINGKLGEKLKALTSEKDKLDTKDDKVTEEMIKKGLKETGLSSSEINKIPWKDFTGIGTLKEEISKIEFKKVVTLEDAKEFAAQATNLETAGEFLAKWSASSTESPISTDRGVEQIDQQ